MTLFELKSAHKPCRCLVCRGKEAGRACDYAEFVKADKHHTRAKKATDTTQNENTIPQTIIDRCLAIIQAPKVTKATLRIYLERNGLQVSGNKLLLCERVIHHYDTTTGAQDVQGGFDALLLAADYLDEEDLVEIDDD